MANRTMVAGAVLFLIAVSGCDSDGGERTELSSTQAAAEEERQGAERAAQAAQRASQDAQRAAQAAQRASQDAQRLTIPRNY